MLIQAPLRARRRTSFCLVGLLALTAFAPVSDHSDTPALVSLARHDARITDFYAFTRGENLVLAVCLDPTVPPGVSSYSFPSDLDVRIQVDNDSAVDFGNPSELSTYGGTVVAPDRIREDVKLMLSFAGGVPTLSTAGVPAAYRDDIQLFAGLRDDPFIRGPRIGRNVAAIVIELPLEAVLADQSTLLLWASTKVPNLSGPMHELGGRALRSQFPENLMLNDVHPSFHQRLTGGAPDVVIYDTAFAASFPNGRELTDDVVDLVGDPRVLGNDDPFPSTNDVPFLSAFPYLAPPQ